MRRIALGYKGASFSGTLVNIDDPDNPVPDDLSNNSELLIRFYRPDGTILDKAASPADDNNDLTDGAEIEYINSEAGEPSILDQVGRWEYTPAVRYDNGNFTLSPNRIAFRVVRA